MAHGKYLPTGGERFHAKWAVIAAILGALAGAGLHYFISRDVTDAKLLELSQDLAKERSRSDRLEMRLEDMKNEPDNRQAQESRSGNASPTRQPTDNLAQVVAADSATTGDEAGGEAPPRGAPPVSISDPQPAAGRSSESAVQARAPAPQSNGGLEVALNGCVATGPTVTCDMKITNMRPDRRIRMWAEKGSRLIDQDGNEVRAASAGLGTNQTIWWSENTLAEGTPLRASLVFEQVPTAATEAALLELTFSEARSPFKVSFRNVTIARD